MDNNFDVEGVVLPDNLELEREYVDEAAEEGVSFGPFQVVDVLGRGKTGKVYKAWRSDLQVHRALKWFNTEDVETEDADSDFHHRLALFHTEAKLMAQLSHTNILKVHGFWKGFYPLVTEMDFIDGISVHSLLLAGRTFPVPVALAIASRVGSALIHCGSTSVTMDGLIYNGIAHCDIKPGNIMIGRDGSVRLIDFGCARPYRADSQNVNCTPRYAAPEIYEGGGEAVSLMSDFYSLALTIQEMISGRNATTGSGLDAPAKLVDRPFAKVKGAGWRDLEVFFKGLLSHDPVKRAMSVQSFHSDLTKLMKVWGVSENWDMLIRKWMLENISPEPSFRWTKNKFLLNF